MAEHKYAEILRAIADGEEVEANAGGNWYDISYEDVLKIMANEYHYYTGVKLRVKPPKVYPTTSFTSAELMEIWWGKDDGEQEAQ